MNRGKLAPALPRARHRTAIAAAALLGVSMTSFSAQAAPDDTGAEPEEVGRARRDFVFAPPRFGVGLRGGWTFNRAEGGIHDFLTRTLTLDGSSLDGFAFAADFSWRMLSRLDVALGLELSSTTTHSEFRDFVDESGAPIEQETTFTQVPLTVSVRLYPFERGRQVGGYAWIRKKVVPYFGGGVGATWYELKQSGEFVDFTDLTIFEDTLTSNGWTFSGHAFAGFDIEMTPKVGLVIEGRYHWASADLGGSFVGFGPIDLTGARAMAGINVEF